MLADGRRVLFPILNNGERAGGIDVLIDHLNALLRRGVAAHPVYAHIGFAYPFRPTRAKPLAFAPLIRGEVFNKKSGLKKLRARAKFVAGLGKRQDFLKLRETDIVVVPEYVCDIFANLFPDQVKILAVQDVFGLLGAFERSGRPGPEFTADFAFAFSTSAAARDALGTLRDGGCHHIPLKVTGGLENNHPPAFQTRKRRQIALFPRKRPDEAAILTAMIRDFLPDWRVVPLAGVADAARDAILRESAVFLSLSHREGFGLPPAEAMLSSCLVVGYTGVGGAEYMTSETCIPVADGDIVALFAELRRAAENYDGQSGGFSGECESVRRNGYAAIASAYAGDGFEEAFDAFWTHVGAELSR